MKQWQKKHTKKTGYSIQGLVATKVKDTVPNLMVTLSFYMYMYVSFSGLLAGADAHGMTLPQLLQCQTDVSFWNQNTSTSYHRL